jgi:protease-4
LGDKFKAITLESGTYLQYFRYVAEGRKMTFAQVDSIAQGRVWSGSEALSGLVDKLEV